jgi:hypothetical protein
MSEPKYKWVEYPGAKLFKEVTFSVGNIVIGKCVYDPVSASGMVDVHPDYDIEEPLEKN